MSNRNVKATAKPQENSIVLDQFHDTLRKFLNALVEVWDDCRVTSSYQQEYLQMYSKTEFSKKEIIKRWHETMSPFYEDCSKHDTTKFFEAELGLLDDIDFKGKYEDIKDNQVSIDAFWSYIVALNRDASMYCGVSSNMMSKVEKSAFDIYNKIQSGQLKKSDLNLFALGEQVANQLGEDDISQLIQNIPDMVPGMTANSELIDQFAPGATELLRNIVNMPGSSSSTPKRAPKVNNKNQRSRK